MTNLEKQKINYYIDGIKYNEKELNWSADDIAIWLDGIIYAEPADGSEDFFNELYTLRDKYIK